MPIDPNNFLHSLALFMASAAGLNYASAAQPRALWRNLAVEQDGQFTDPYSVLRIYPGPPLRFDPLQRWSVQCETTGKSSDGTLARAQAWFGTLLAADGTPLQMKTIGAVKVDGSADTPASYRLVGIDLLQRPGLLGVDDRKRHRAVFNFDVGVYPTA